MNKLKKFENYNNNNCNANLTILHWKSGTYRLLIKLISLSGDEYYADGVQLKESDAKKLINEFGAQIEERY